MENTNNIVRMMVFALVMIALFAAGVIVYEVKSTVEELQDENAALRVRVSVMRGQVQEAAESRSETRSGGAEQNIERVEETDSDYVWPIAKSDIKLTSPHGIRESPFHEDKEVDHNGVDMAGTWKAQIVAVADGQVVEHWPVPGTPHPTGGKFEGHNFYGGMVRVEHEDGVESLYGHLSSTRVHEGQRVKAGEVIGRQGETGKTDGAHLHFEMKVKGESVNPLQYLPGIEEASDDE